VTTRKYEQRVRAEAAAETRRRVLDAVARRLRAAPTEPINLDTVAREAKVSRSTIYVVFGSKAGLLDAFARDMWERTGLAELTEAVASKDPRDHLRRGIDASCRMYAADLELYRVLFAMSQLDPGSVGGAIQSKEEGRSGGMAYLAQRLAEGKVLRQGVTAEQAADLLWMLCSFEAFDLLHTGRNLSVEEAIDVLVTTAERALCR
jgi:AcrR family transcriptional regulator